MHADADKRKCWTYYMVYLYFTNRHHTRHNPLAHSVDWFKMQTLVADFLQLLLYFYYLCMYDESAIKHESSHLYKTYAQHTIHLWIVCIYVWSINQYYSLSLSVSLCLSLLFTSINNIEKYYKEIQIKKKQLCVRSNIRLNEKKQQTLKITENLMLKKCCIAVLGCTCTSIYSISHTTCILHRCNR